VTHGTVQLLLVLIVIAGAAAVKGTIGFGFPLVAVPLLSVLIGPRAAVPLTAIPTLLSNIMLATRGGGTRASASLILLLAGVVAGTLAGALLITALDPQVLSIIIGGLALLYVGATALHLTFSMPEPAGRRAAPVIGLLAGLMGGMTGAFAPLLASYLHLLRLAKQEFIFWITVMFLAGNVVQIASYAHLGLYPGPVLTLALVGCVPMAIGTWSGILLQDHLHPETFGRIVLAIVFVASLSLLAQGLRP